MNHSSLYILNALRKSLTFSSLAMAGLATKGTHSFGIEFVSNEIKVQQSLKLIKSNLFLKSSSSASKTYRDVKTLI